MQVKANSVNEYITQVASEKQEAVSKLRHTLIENLPEGFTEGMSYGMIGYGVSHDIYPKGYHCDPKLPLPFISIAAQKNFIALYHMGIYANQTLFDWFVNEYPNHCKSKLDMGKSCVRFKKMDDIPYQLIGELATKMTCEEWISCYENAFLKDKHK